MSCPGLFHVFPDFSRSKGQIYHKSIYFSRFFQKIRKTPHFSRLFKLLPTLIYVWKYSFIPSLAVLFRHLKSFLLVLLTYLNCRILTDHLLLGNNIYRVLVTVFLFEISHVNMKNLLK